MFEYTFYNNKIKMTQNIKANNEEEARELLKDFCIYWKKNVNKETDISDFNLKCRSSSRFLY